jgi:hypothetical protein
MSMEADTPEVVRVPTWFLNAEELTATRAKVTKLQQRAARKGFTGLIDVTAVPATRNSTSAGGLPLTVHGFDVTITGDPPRYAGWRFVAAVDAADGGTILRYPPGSTAEVPNDQLRAGECDHCHTTRARRSTVLVAHEESGQLLQVGRSCLKDFLGHTTLPVFLTTDDVSASLGGSLSGTPAAWDVHSVLTYAAAAVEAFGWTPASASEHGRVPTRDLVQLALKGGRGADQLRDQLAPHLADATDRAPKIRSELLAGLTAGSGYEANLVAVLRGDAVDAKHLGLAVSAIPAHQRLTDERAREASRREAAQTVDHVGVVGEKVTLSGVVRTALRVDGYTYHSPASVLLVVDCGTAVAKLTTAAAWAYGVHVGDPLTVTGTVKAHTEWNGLKQTVLTRPKKHDPAPVQESMPDAAPRLWETVTSPRLDGANAARHTTVRRPARGVPLAR